MPAPDLSHIPAAVRLVDAPAAAAQLSRLVRRAEAPWLHTEVARRMAQRLAFIRKQPQAVIDWGASVSGSAAALELAYPKARRIAVSPVRQDSLALTEAPWWSLRRWSRRQGAAVDERVLVDGSADLLWANMVLHFASDTGSLLQRWQRLIAADGFLMFSTFGPDTLLELRDVYTELGWPVPTQAFVDMHDLGDALVQAGFADPVMDQEHVTLTWGSAAELIAELRTLGGNLHPQRFAGMRTPRWRSRLEFALAARADAGGRIGLSFEIVYGHAFKAPPRVPLSAEARVPLEDLRTMARQRRSG